MAERMTGRRLEAPRLRAVTAAVDGYVPPNANTQDRQLAQALGDLEPSLARLSGVLGERKAQQDKAAGEARAREAAAQGRTMAEELRSGKRRPEESPWFRVGFYETMGRSNGQKYIGDFLAALQQQPDLAETTDLGAFDAFERQFREQWVPQNLGEQPEPFLANAFGSTVDGQLAGLRNEFARGVGQRMLKQNTEAFHAEVFGLVQQFHGTDFSPSEQAAALRLAQDRQVATGGMTYEQVNRLTVSAIAAAAVRLRSFETLDLIDQIPTSTNSKAYLGGTAYGSEAREKAESAIARAIDDDVRREEALAKRTRERGIQTVTSGLVQALQQDPGADISPFVEEMRKVDPTYIPTLMNIRDSTVTGVFNDDPQLVQALTVGIYTAAPGDEGYTTRRDLDTAYGNKRMTFGTYLRLSQEIEQRDKEGGTGRMLRNPLLADISTEVRRIFSAEYRDETPAVRFNAQQAADEAQYLMLQWLQQNPGATPEQTLAQKTLLTNQVVRRRVGIQQTMTDTAGAPDMTGQVAAIPPARFYLADPVVSGQFSREFEEVQTGRRGRFSPVFLEHLRRNNVAVTDLKAIEALVREDEEWHRNGSPKP